MSRESSNEGIQPSILDRLIDPASGGTSWKRGYGPEQIEKAVFRDLEDLLNARQTAWGVPEVYRETVNSVFNFGLPDLISLNAITPNQRESIGRVLEEIIQRFEPRLKDVQAHMVNTPSDGLERTVKFRVEGKLCLDPAPAVAFDTILELTTGKYTVTAADS
jgi:type VI secretion system protein ImpF